MTGSDATKLAEIFELFQRHTVAREVKPAVEEHAAVACREDEAVAIEPAGLIGVEAHGRAEEDRSNIGGSKREAEVAGFAFRDSVHSQAARIAGCDFKRRGV
jgi:hypothetical protein